MTLRGRSTHSPVLTSSRSSAYDPIMASLADSLNNSNHSNSSNSGAARRYSKKQLNDASSVLDQLHAEQKSTIEALTYQIEFYRKREERYKKEVDTLQQLVGDSNNHDNNTTHNGDSAVSVSRLAMENRLLGDELDTLRNKQSVWSDEKRRFVKQQHDLEQQLQDAKLSLTTFTQAIEQLELKIQRKDTEVQTRVLEMEQDVRGKSHECAQLKQQLEKYQQTSADAQRNSLSMANEVRDLRERLSDHEARNRQREVTMVELQNKLSQATSEATALRREVENKNFEIQELRHQVERSKEVLALREQLLTSDASSRQESEAQRHELRTRMARVEQDKASLQREVESLKQQLQTARQECETMRTKLMSKDHGVMVATLRSEVAGVKERLRNEFKHERDTLVDEKASLSQQISVLTSKLAEKERFIHRLQDELLVHESEEKQTSRETTTLHSTIHRLEAEAASAHAKYQQLQDARSCLAQQLDYGFKELLEDDNTASSALRQVENLQHELSEAKQALAASEVRHNAVADELNAVQQQHEKVSTALRRKIDELYEQMRHKDDGVFNAKQLEMNVHFAEQEKNAYASEVATLEQNADKLRDVIATLKAEKAQQHAKIIAMEDDVAKQNEKVDQLKVSLKAKDLELEASKQEASRLTERIRSLQRELEEANERISSGQEEKSKRERKLLRERRQLEEQVAKLVGRIEDASSRNEELGNKVIKLMKQMKSYESEIIALQTQFKAEKKKTMELEKALGSVQRSAGRDAECSEEVKRRLHEATSLKESYQGEVHQLKKSLERAQSEKEVVHRQRDDAIQRVSMLMKCQDQIKTTVESHTTELVEELEALQAQLDDERKRCTVFMGNEKTLLRDISDKNALLTRFQQTIASLEQQVVTLGRQTTSSSPSLSPQPSTASKKAYSYPTHHHHHQQQSRAHDPRYASYPFSTSSSPTSLGINATTPKTSNSSAVSSSAQELDRLLGNLERISEFSSVRSPSESFCR